MARRRIGHMDDDDDGLPWAPEGDSCSCGGGMPDCWACLGTGHRPPDGDLLQLDSLDAAPLTAEQQIEQMGG